MENRFTVRIEEVESGYFTVFSADGNESYHFGDGYGRSAYNDCVEWCETHNAEIVSEW